MYFADIFQLLPGQYHKVLADVEVDLSYYMQVGVLQQGIVRKNTAGDRVFDCHYAYIGHLLLYLFNQLRKRSTTLYLNILIIVSLSSYLVKTPFESLNCDVHCLLFYFCLVVATATTDKNEKGPRLSRDPFFAIILLSAFITKESRPLRRKRSKRKSKRNDIIWLIKNF